MLKEHITPPVVEVPRDLNITDLLEQQVLADPQRALFARQTTPGQWTDVAAADVRDDVRTLARGLAAAGLGPGDRIGIMAPTRYEWTLMDLAIWYAGCVTVPIYETSSPSQVAWIVSDADVRAVVCDTARHRTVVDTALRQEGLEPLVGSWLIEDGGLDELRGLAGRGPDEAAMEQRRSAATLEDLATIIYTSGTTGKPKGCELTHGNFAELSLQTLGTDLAQVVNPQSSTVMFIPLAHVFARFISVLALAAGAKVGHTADVSQLVPDLQSFRPTFLLAVPRVFEKVYNSAQLKAETGGKGKVFAAGARTAIEYSRAREQGRVPLPLRIRHAVFEKLLYGKIRGAMGGRVVHAVSGGGPLGARLGHFFHGIGVNIMEGYGLTETTAPVTVNLPTEVRIGTVGKPIPGNGVRIADDGEILARGVCLMRGYHNRPDVTAQEIVDGWFRTGDIGDLDEDGFLTITGRKKEIIVTAGGKNVVPAVLEDQIRADAVVSQCVVVGDQRPFVAALVTLDTDILPTWLGQHGIPAETPVEELATHPVVVDHVQSVIDRANEAVSKAESIRAFRIAPVDFTVESGQMTPSLKIKRSVVLADFGPLVEEIYAAPKPA
ncbi:long-chain fatty acid--CoA ligase [Citricoccus sp. SGAir0253]|uniref:AMP-dependent synthetase/ligase n=1 Tax=Citricoccus sp. SGAir0253 TaxID=2567881 RepID=UPI0010CD40D9|nr:AMP-dependent synthetase/ligase [Citricoccus sp. SGAir0253]QCU77820.1 long-chain fatty acid--CoA ligase [Citricoccus sp. SGAir0253]